ncbi:site-specific integrase [Bacillus haimaensis]|uniref:site-specific integrase n=1 Tax=Bacillus haimaensis TaxID=3160967 RepID=UPI003AA7DB6F
MEENKIIDRLITKPPEPTYKNPYAQVDFIFQQVGNLKHNKATQSNYKSALYYYKRFLQDTNNYDNRLSEDSRFFLNEYWDEFSLSKVKKYIDNNNIKGMDGYLTSNTLVGYFSCIRNVMEEAVHHNLTKTKDVFWVSIGSAVRETDQNVAYLKEELDEVMKAVTTEIGFTYKIFKDKGYKKTGIGVDPRKLKRGQPAEVYGWNNIDNFRWYFENVLNCEPILGTPENNIKHNSFLVYAPGKYFKRYGGLPGIYRMWGVTPYISAEIIMPLLIKLAMETGLNANTLYDLNIDCFKKQHPLSGTPYLSYYKGRSGGEKELHINTGKYEDDMEIKNFRHHQAVIIENTINQIKHLTEGIRNLAPTYLQSKLFIFQSSSQRSLGEIKLISSSVSSNWCSNIVKKYNLKSEVGEDLIFSVQRFRPTRIARMVEKGIDIFEIQHEMGHNSINTTLNYLEKNQFNVISKRETNNALNNIFRNLEWASKEKPEYATSNNLNNNVIYKGIVCDCKNPFNPPEQVKQLKGYQSGDACSRFNMCFFCDNVLIFKKHLPFAWVYKKQIEVSLDSNKGDLPNELFYNRTLDVINNLFDSDFSEFNDEDLEWAKKVAEGMDELIDPVTYKPVNEVINTHV